MPIPEHSYETLLLAKDVDGKIRLVDLSNLQITVETKDSRTTLSRFEGKIADLEEQLDTATSALEFYADSANYEAGKAGKTAIEKDKGRRARQALDQIIDDGEEDGEPGED